MNAESDNFATPKQTKRLGLRRSSSIIKNHSGELAMGSSAKSRTTEVENPVTTPRKRLPQSDRKINYKNLEHNDVNKSTVSHAITPGTPKTENSTNLIRMTVSTNCRPYRLALSKKVREKMTKKRLEFYLANEMERSDTEEQREDNNQQKDNNVARKTFNSREELLQQIEIARKELACRQEHMAKVEELKQAIAIWKAGFSLALQDLQQKFEPRLETTNLLEHLHIPPEMIKYIND